MMSPATGKRAAEPYVTISIRVQPRASRNAVVGWTGDTLNIRLTAPPVEGAANTACLKFLADLLDVPSLSGRTQTPIEGLNHEVAPRGGHRCHVQHGPDSGASAPAGAGASQGATVPVQRGDPDQGGDLLAIQRAQLWQVRQQGPAQH